MGSAHRIPTPNTGRNTSTMIRRIESSCRRMPGKSPAVNMRATAGASATSMEEDSMLAGVAMLTAAEY